MLNARAQHQLDFKSHRKLSARKRRECNNSESLIIFKQVLFSIRVLFPLNLFDSLHEPFFEELKRKKKSRNVVLVVARFIFRKWNEQRPKNHLYLFEE